MVYYNHEKRDDEDLLMIPKGIQTELIRNVHEVDHFSTKKVEELINKDYSIKGLHEKVQRVGN